ncbi:MAG TPA: 30S ribosomal protein S8 [Candidatus Sulfotelmatobacter sp.]|nr:30S ribosomal protein S8 [Candidatus Sulfotelmatobacter sp.]
MDSIADMLVRLRSGLNAKKESVDVPHSKMKEEIAKLLLAEGFIGQYETHERMKKKHLRIKLKYTPDRKSVIAKLLRVSTPGRRVYVGAAKVPRVQAGFGTALISTSKGLMTDEAARRQKLGGEVICYIW